MLLSADVINDGLRLQYFMLAINNLCSPILSLIYLPVRVLDSSIGRERTVSIEPRNFRMIL